MYLMPRVMLLLPQRLESVFVVLPTSIHLSLSFLAITVLIYSHCMSLIDRYLSLYFSSITVPVYFDCASLLDWCECQDISQMTGNLDQPQGWLNSQVHGGNKACLKAKIPEMTELIQQCGMKPLMLVDGTFVMEH